MTDADARVGGRYRLDTRLASGGMGTVWRGWDERLHRVVAVKLLHLQPGLTAAERDIAVQRAMREARITARLHHPNAVEVYDIVDEAAGPCLIMQYVPSRSLQEIVRDSGPLSPAEAARIGTQVAGALAAAHQAGIVHRDVKPGNVLIADDGTAKITDFGISHAFDDVSLTSTGLVMGTPAYLPPEVARGARSDFASDVYALGATLYMAVEGRPPFGDDPNPMAVLHRVASGAWDPPVRAGALAPALQAMMATDPRRRPSMVEVGNMLPSVHSMPTVPAPRPRPATTRVLGNVPPPAPRYQPPYQPYQPPSDPRYDQPRRRGWIPVAVAVLVVAIGVVLAVVLLSDSNGTPSANTTTQHGGVNPTGHARAHSNSPSPATHSTTQHSAPPSTSTPASSTSSSSTPPTTTPPRQHGAATDQELASAVINYFQIVPGDLDTGWQLLTPHFQQTTAGGRATYDEYWNSVERVDVSNAVGQSPHDASATLTYHYKDGRVISEPTHFKFLRQGGVLKIDEES